MVRETLRGYLALASGFTDDLRSTSRRNRESLVLLVRHEVEQTVKRLGLAPAGDVEELTRRVRELERAVRELKAAARSGGDGGAG